MSTSSNPTPTIDQLLAIEACREAARRYSYGLDRLDAEVMKTAYWPDGTDNHGLFVGNAHTFCDMVVASHARWTFTMHSIYNHRVDVHADGVNAGGEAYCITHLFNADERQMSTWYGRYQDAYEQRDGEWRIMDRVCVHHGTTVEHMPDAMAIDESKFRQGSFDRPANQRPIGP